MKNRNNYIELDVLPGSFFWSNAITGVSFNGAEFALPPIAGFTDTGTTCTYLPSILGNSVLDVVTKNIAT